MLFDLRGRGRRRTVRIIYSLLALIFLIGFVGFGVGGVGGGGGGLLNFLGEEKETGGSSFAGQIETQRKILSKHPNDASAWAALASAQLHEGSNEAYVEASTGKFTSKGKELLGEIANSWSHYVAIESKPSPELAQRMLVVFAEEGLNEPAKEVEVLQIVIASKPQSAALYGELANFAYQAKNTGLGDLAAKKAVSLTPPAQRAKVVAELARIKGNPTGNPANETFTGTTNGKVYTVKVGAKGQGTVLKTSPAPAITNTATKKK